MSKSFVYYRFDVDCDGIEIPDSSGYCVKAEDAINRDAVLQAQIRTLEVQLRDARTALDLKGVSIQREDDCSPEVI